ncbi:MAG: NAD(P)/FAD-dependent oxidoreductase [Burkholderiaceae bacterium]
MTWHRDTDDYNRMPTPVPTPRVLVVGAGPVGLSLAWRLCQAGLPVSVFEAEPAISDQLRASTFHPPTLDLFEADGITAELVAAGRITAQWQIRQQDGGERVVFDLAAIAAHTRHPYRLQCRQARLCEALLRRLPPGTVQFSAKVTAVGQSVDGVWLEQRGQRIDGTWLVGCDGARSLVREAIGARFSGETYPEQTILATTHLPFENHLQGLSGVNYILAGRQHLLAVAPARRVADLTAPARRGIGRAGADRCRDRRAHRTDRARRPADRDHREADLPGASAHRRPILRRPPGAGRRLGHLNSPKGGMGMNGGIHDAINLADKLVQAAAGAELPALLARYQRQRLPIAAEEILAQADANRRRMNTRDPAERAAHLAGLQAIAADPTRAREPSCSGHR